MSTQRDRQRPADNMPAAHEFSNDNDNEHGACHSCLQFTYRYTICYAEAVAMLSCACTEVPPSLIPI